MVHTYHMSWLNAFKKVGVAVGGAAVGLAKSPTGQNIAIGAVKSINPIAGILLSTLIQGINNVQEVLPDPESNDLKKKIVRDRVLAQAAQHGETIDDETLDILIEGILKTIQQAANKPTK